MPELQHQLFDLNEFTNVVPLRPQEQSVLVLACNPSTLDPHLTGTVKKLSGLLAGKIHTEIITASSEAALQTQLFRLQAQHTQYALVVVIGTGNGTRLSLSEGHGVSWAQLALQMLLPLEPRHVLMLSTLPECEAAVQTLFEAIPMLKEVYVSPALEAKLQADVLKFMVSFLLTPMPDENDRVLSRQIAEKLIATGTIVRWTWRDSLKQRLLNTFELLTEMERLEVAAEIMRRTSATARPLAEMQRRAAE